jgi:hypothetical protein
MGIFSIVEVVFNTMRLLNFNTYELPPIPPPQPSSTHYEATVKPAEREAVAHDSAAPNP